MMNNLLAIDFDNLHQILRNLYEDMIPLCGDMIGVAKGVAGLGALFYVASRVWQALSRAEPIDVYPLLRPFAIGLCILFFPTVVLGTINTVLSPVVKGAHGILESQTFDMREYQQQREKLEYEARVREGKAWLVDNQAWDRRMEELGITDTPEIIGMYLEWGVYEMKKNIREWFMWLLELIFQAAALVIDTLRTFFLVVLSILGPIAFAISVYDGFQSTLTQWISRYVSVYMWLPVSDLFSSILARIQVLMLSRDVELLKDPTYIPDSSNGVYIIFLLIGILGYFTIPSVANWIIQSGGLGNAGRPMNQAAGRTAAFAGGLAGAAAGNIAGRLFKGSGGNGDSGGGSSDGDQTQGRNVATDDSKGGSRR